MTDKKDIGLAADRLNEAINSLEQNLSNLMVRLHHLENEKTKADNYRQEAESFKTDRIKLAQRLDDSAAKIETLKAREAKFCDKEAEFNSLARETAQELERVMGQVRNAINAVAESKE
ncbi:MAG: hypothetical protein GDA39_07200 [Hyphomonadaceae bacterium]|nr:hypothetical protein [Hyphomonadaceae bacterium]MBC6412665.1 hypothetical protein [Hyphomonadaceae bacterium]